MCESISTSTWNHSMLWSKQVRNIFWSRNTCDRKKKALSLQVQLILFDATII